MKTWLKIVLLILCPIFLRAQIHFVVTADSLLDENRAVYMASDLNNWSPRDERFKLAKVKGHFELSIPDTVTRMEYKFTQGSWDHVEGSQNGGLISNHVFIREDYTNPERVHINGWEKRAAYSLHVTKVPYNTPHDAKIYVSGNFNDWRVNDEDYEVKKEFDGTYKVKIYTTLPQIQFKFHRGNWDSAEGRKDGRARHNRVLDFDDSRINKFTKLEIDSWEDLQSTFNFYSISNLLLLFAGFHGLLISIAIVSIQSHNREANKLLVVLILFSAIMMLLRVTSTFREVANILPKLVLTPLFITYTFGPAFYFYIRKLLFNETLTFSRIYRTGIPILIQFLMFLPFFVMDGKTFQFKSMNDELDLTLVYMINGLFGMLYNFYYLQKSRRAVELYALKYPNETALDQNVEYLKTVFMVQIVYLAITILTGGLYIVQLTLGYGAPEVIDGLINATWITFSFISYFLGYYAINQPEFFRLSTEDEELDIEQTITVVDERKEAAVLEVQEEQTNYSEWMHQIQTFMEEEKPFLNPNLTINDLALQLNIQSHIISKVINEGFQKNFFDFINTYRIEEFKKQIKNPKYKHYTILGIAYEVGFNSKSSFNRAFKKHTQITPTEYFQKVDLN
ncbi:helix-turn-helix domain-containing protein [Marinilongibacter aquaticus]|uniref:helix-turn-helix domain-containing protein n=1 Tax=Marinilongibacter aquaticus TaxID=2975157 RepID=UPI0021BD372E|nr:helix-turn-helix domain-containing protein [Marinilongibacter aquaticus]UBM59642.1 helix-turn-helix domain-containing protein [Marinilongibacter aquaticus]